MAQRQRHRLNAVDAAVMDKLLPVGLSLLAVLMNMTRGVGPIARILEGLIGLGVVAAVLRLVGAL